MDINDIYLCVGYFSRELGSGMFGPDRFNQYIQIANLKYFTRYVGLPEQYQIGNPMSSIQWQLTFQVNDRMYPFIVPALVIPRAISGYFPYPPDYAAFSSMRMSYTYANPDCTTGYMRRRVEMVPDGEEVEREDSFLHPPTLRRPIGTWANLGFEILPKQIDMAILRYLRQPAVPFRAYTGTDVYVPGSSTQFEYPQICYPQLIVMLLKMVGISVQDEEVIQYAAKIEQTAI